ncbi:MAG: MopE-related protein [Polyangiaceae bacterium]|nr:MopE-related protein [Polyangiaceae bacterium]
MRPHNLRLSSLVAVAASFLACSSGNIPSVPTPSSGGTASGGTLSGGSSSALGGRAPVAGIGGGAAGGLGGGAAMGGGAEGGLTNAGGAPTMPSGGTGSGGFGLGGSVAGGAAGSGGRGGQGSVMGGTAGQAGFGGMVLEGPCTPGEQITCFDGPAQTLGVAPCKNGHRTCLASGLGFGACQGQVLPTEDICGDGLDQDCSGQADDAADDADGDGFTICAGDCCDKPGQCANPFAVNPGGFDELGNGVDDDCNGFIDDTPVPCDDSLPVDGQTPAFAANAMGLCGEFFTESHLPGYLGGFVTQADGSGYVEASALTYRPSFGPNVSAREGQRMMLLSTGRAAAAADAGFDPAQSQRVGEEGPLPATWLLANGGSVPVPPGCPPIAQGNTAYDSAMVTLALRVPTNAHSFSVQVQFYTSDFAEGVCSAYADQFVVLLDSSSPLNPPDTNIARVRLSSPSGPWLPVSANLAVGSSGYFTNCVNGLVGCQGSLTSNYSDCTGTSALLGTGFDTPTPGACTSNALRGASTGWRTIRGNVLPGELVNVSFAVWDSGDNKLDSTVLVDDFKWSTEVVSN